MNEFKNKKLAEFDNNFVDGNRCSQINENKNVNDIKQFISDLIDEMESNLFLKDIVTKTRIDTIQKLLHPLRRSDEIVETEKEEMFDKELRERVKNEGGLI